MPKLPFWVRNLPHRLRGWKQEAIHAAGLAPTGELRVTVFRRDGTVERLGVVSRRVITTAGVNYLVDAFQGLGQLAADFRWHDSGTGSNAEAVGDTGLQTAAGPARVAGTQTEGAANIYRTVATISYGSGATITEHGVFSASTSGTLLDRSVFAGIAVSGGDSIQFTYNLTVPSGG